MYPDPIEAWREHLAGQMQERYGLSEQEAQNLVTLWLRSEGLQPAPRRVPRPSRISEATLTGRGARQARSARA